MSGSKEDIVSTINEIIDLVERIRPVGKIPKRAQRIAVFEPIENRLKNLEFLVSEQMPHLLENVGRIKWHYRAAFGVDIIKGHSFEEHMAWANRDITRIRSELDS